MGKQPIKVSDSTDKMPVPNPKQRLKQSKLIIPVHASPVPLYPSLHVHLYEPKVFEQFAFTSQSKISLLHSSMSGR